jgi:RimJ/RimL family protein N-acetyltransferase
VAVQEIGAVAGLGHIFPQDRHPFPTAVIQDRWAAELDDPAVHAYVWTESGRIRGFAARRDDELLHFGTALETWGTGLAVALHDALVATFPGDLGSLRLRVFAENSRARRFYERLGWRPTGQQSVTSFAPYPTLLEYRLDLRARG